MKRALCLLYLWLTFATAPAQIGAPLWTNRYDGPAGDYDGAVAVRVDKSGTVYVTGASLGTNGYTDIVTISYSAAGSALWTNGYGASGGAHSNPRAMAVGVGKVFVTGTSFYSNRGEYVTIAYSDFGVPLWTNHYGGPENPTAITVDRFGNVLVTGASYYVDSDFVTIKYSPAGAAIWTNRYGGPGNSDWPFAIQSDLEGNVIVTGESFNSEGDLDFATVKYSEMGLAIWTNRYNGPANAADTASGLDVDGNDNVFVTGYSFGANGDLDYATIKYSSEGVPLWTNRYSGWPERVNYAVDIVVNGTGDAIVTGHSGGANGYFDFTTIKYSGAGLAQWTNRYNGSENNNAYPSAIVVDGSNNVYVTGSSSDSVGNKEYATIAYSSAGGALWTNRYNRTANGDDLAVDVAVDSSGNAFVTGFSGTGTACDYVTIKYSAAQPNLLTILKHNSQVVLYWTDAGLSLQSAPASTGTFTNLPGAASPYTNPISGAQQFFRLISN